MQKIMQNKAEFLLCIEVFLSSLAVYLVTLVQLTGNVIVEYGPIPVAGSCTIAPETGYALTTQYNLTCTGFSISGGHQLKYSLYTHHQEDYSKGTCVPRHEKTCLLGVRPCLT